MTSRVKMGTWRGRGGRRIVLVRRGTPTLRLSLHGQRYDTVFVSTPDADALALQLPRRLTGLLRNYGGSGDDLCRVPAPYAAGAPTLRSYRKGRYSPGRCSRPRPTAFAG